jgi:predicted metal-dependent hydrolase
VRAGLIGWYREHAEQRFPGRVAAWASRLGVAPAEVLVRGQDRRWGSCDAQGVLRLNWRVVQAPARLQDYVIVHELAHLGERDHSPVFWSLVGRALPDYEQRRAALKRLGPERVW